MTNAVWIILGSAHKKSVIWKLTILDFTLRFTLPNSLHLSKHDNSKCHRKGPCHPASGFRTALAWTQVALPGGLLSGSGGTWSKKEYEPGSWSKECQKDKHYTFMTIHLFATSKAFNLSWVTSWAARLCAPYAPRPKIMVRRKTWKITLVVRTSNSEDHTYGQGARHSCYSYYTGCGSHECQGGSWGVD